MASSLERSDLAIFERYGFEAASLKTRHMALRCLHNLLHEAPLAVRVFVEKTFIKRAIYLLKTSST